MSSVRQRLAELSERIAAAAAAADRDVADVTLVAVSKGHEPGAILEAYAAGHRDFGESRGQALAAKAHELPEDIRWHFIGPLQSNKVRIVRPHAVLLHSFDRRSLVGPWLKGLGAPPPALLQVNIGSEPQKAGVEPDRAIETFEEWREQGIDLRGVMAIPPFADDPEETRPFFRQLRALRDDLEARTGERLELSMGMTNDYEVAVAEGSTILRVGTAIFGQRQRVEIT